MQAAAYGAAYSFMALFVAVYWLFAIGVTVVQYLALWKIFKKAGQPGWKSLVPLVNGHTLYKLFWKPVYYWLNFAVSAIVGVMLGAWLGTVQGMESTALRDFPMTATAGMWVVYLVFAVVQIVWTVKLALGMARGFGYGGGFAAGLVFLPLVFRLILAFNQDAYQGNPYRKTVPPVQEPQGGETME